jgi:hypothetical protein
MNSIACVELRAVSAVTNRTDNSELKNSMKLGALAAKHSEACRSVKVVSIGESWNGNDQLGNSALEIFGCWIDRESKEDGSQGSLWGVRGSR